MTSPTTRPRNRPRREGSRRRRCGGAVLVPPRPADPGDLPGRSEVEWLREQEALIEEARRRARRRRQRYGALALLGGTVIVVVGFVRVGGVDPRDVSGISAPFGQGAPSRAALAPAPGNRYSEAPLISADGRFLAFDSHASNLVAGDTNGRNDVFVRDRTSRKTTRVSVRTGGEQGNDASYLRAISDDGRFVVFSSYASNLVAGDTDGCNGERLTCSDVFVRDRMSGKTTRVSVGNGGKLANGDSSEAAISADGRFVVFSSYASNLIAGDTNKCVQKYLGGAALSSRRYSCADVFVRDRATGRTERVSVSGRDLQANGQSGLRGLAISADGRFVAFGSEASNLVASDTNKECFSPIVRAHYSNDRVRYNCGDVFVRDRMTGRTTRASVGSGGKQANGASYEPSISADGRFVAFSSEASNLVAGDIDSCPGMNCPEVFIRDRVTGKTTRVSLSSDGKQVSGPSSEPSISADGRYVAFSSYAAGLVAADTNTCVTVGQREKFACRDVFVRDRATGRTERVSVSSAGEQANGYSDNPTISADGHFVTFSSAASNLVHGDTNNLRDVFARDRATGTTSLVSIRQTRPARLGRSGRAPSSPRLGDESN
jgi:Tol biopolymer transport system component